MPIQKICAECGKNFLCKPVETRRRFCSKSCVTAYERTHGRIAAQVPPVKFECKTCSAEFEMKPSYVTAYRKKHGKDPLYCSTKCMGVAKRLTDEQWQVHCIQCGNPMPIQRRPGGTLNREKRLCSTACRSAFRRLAYQAKHFDQVPTRRIARNGYVRLIVPGTNGAPSRDVFEHRYVMEQHLGRPLRPEETVHHKDGDRQHNEIGNLELFSSRHGPGQRVADQVEIAVEILCLYPELVHAASAVRRAQHISDQIERAAGFQVILGALSMAA